MKLRRIVGTRFQELFHSPPGVLFTFPSRYLSAIGHQGIFRLSRWSCQIRTGFLGPRTTWEMRYGVEDISTTGVSPTLPGLSRPFVYTLDFLLRTSVVALVHAFPQPPICNPYQVSHRPGLASSAFARHYSRNHMLFSLPVGTEMFHFPTFPPRTLYIQVRVTGDEACRVSPFGHPGITVRLSTPPGLSQIPTSFFGSWCQGIHRAPLKT